MLKNITKETITVRYNGIELTAEEGKSIDVRNYGVSNKDVKATEIHIIRKNPGIMEQVNTIDDPKLEKEYANNLKKGIDRIAALERENESYRINNKELAEKHGADVAQIEELRGEIKSLRKDAAKHAAEIKDLEDEVSKLRGSRMGKNKPGA